ncbi:UNVERIFIED_CONTAM: hypothetical protein IGO34_22790 [Salmonella enterica subsp. enterica serovar Weltevreden]
MSTPEQKMILRKLADLEEKVERLEKKNRSAKAALEDLRTSLGLVSKRMNALGDESIRLRGWISQIDRITAQLVRRGR